MRKIIGFVISICMVVALVGCGSEGGYIDTSSENKEFESSLMTENSATQSSQDEQKPSESGTQVPSETETQTPSESETQEPSESETQKPSESETQEQSESETEEPSESETQEPSESETQKPSESETQKPSESETQEPSETETQEPSESGTQEPSETETQEPSEKYDEYILSTQSYEYAEQVSEKYYVVMQSIDDEDCYGLVDFNGTEIVPIEYSGYQLVAEDEIEFTIWVDNYDEEGNYIGQYAYVYNINTGRRILEYVTIMQPAKEEEYCEEIIVNEVEHSMIYSNVEPIMECDESIYTSYQNGLIKESYLVYDYCELYECGYVPRYHVSFKNAKTGALIYEAYTVFDEVPFWGSEWENEDGEIEVGIEYLGGMHPFDMFSSDISEGKAVMLEDSIHENKYYLVVVGVDGYVKHEIKEQDISMFDSNKAYSNDWIKMPWTAKMINTKTMEIIDMSIEEEVTDHWYFGIGEYYAIKEFDDELYTIYKGATTIATDYEGLYFSKYYILGKREDGKFAFIDYDGKEQLLVDDYGSFLNDRYMVNDGVGVYYVDKTLKRVSDYIYKGDVENCHSGAIMIDGKYYLIAKK